MRHLQKHPAAQIWSSERQLISEPSLENLQASTKNKRQPQIVIEQASGYTRNSKGRSLAKVDSLSLGGSKISSTRNNGLRNSLQIGEQH